MRREKIILLVLAALALALNAVFIGKIIYSVCSSGNHSGVCAMDPETGALAAKNSAH